MAVNHNRHVIVFISVYSVLVNCHQVTAPFRSHGKRFCVLKLSESFMTLCYYIYIYVYWIFKSCSLRVKALAYYTRNCNKMQLSSIHTTPFFSQRQQFFKRFYMWAELVLKKIFAVSCVVCKDLICVAKMKSLLASLYAAA